MVQVLKLEKLPYQDLCWQTEWAMVTDSETHTKTYNRNMLTLNQSRLTTKTPAIII